MGPKSPRGLVLRMLTAAVLWPHGLGAAQPAPIVLSIDHRGVGCVVAGRFPRLEAALSPTAQVARARVLFRAKGTTAWYAVGMKPEGAVFTAALPKPKKGLTGFDYYIEAVDRGFTISRTAEYSPQVVGNAVACEQGKVMAGSVGTASVVVDVPAGAPVVPAGFASEGVVAATAGAGGAGAAGAGAGAAAAGGIGATALIIGGAAAAGAAAAVVVATKDDDTPPPTTPPPPAASGRWSGTLIENDTRGQCTANWDIAMDLVESGGSLTGPMTVTGVSSTTGVYQCAGPGFVFGPNPISDGTVAGTAVHWTFRFFFAQQQQTWSLDGVLSEDRRSMSGTWKWLDLEWEDSGTWTATRQ